MSARITDKQILNILNRKMKSGEWFPCFSAGLFDIENEDGEVLGCDASLRTAIKAAIRAQRSGK